jgi:hypothetical protein
VNCSSGADSLAKLIVPAAAAVGSMLVVESAAKVAAREAAVETVHVTAATKAATAVTTATATATGTTTTTTTTTTTATTTTTTATTAASAVTAATAAATAMRDRWPGKRQTRRDDYDWNSGHYSLLPPLTRGSDAMFAK